MNSILRRRRALMGAQITEAQWEEIPFSYDQFGVAYSSSNTSWNTTVNTIRVYTTANGTYKNASMLFSTSSGYEYRYACKISVTTGKGKIACRTTGGTTVSGTSSITVSNEQNIDVIFQHNATINKLSLFCTWSTSEAGNVTFTDLKLYRRPI